MIVGGCRRSAQIQINNGNPDSGSGVYRGTNELFKKAF
jgi:hypothetical protein